ncbi:TatD DNase family protein [Paraoerskovia marina]|uniref:TatD DNase family protein n=1 Tax=Paraoerskovia marina TaxID=545619 RepID=A0A1H1QF79_9CELL|nr:TatD family hydrolase [Paraoerskovia marina]SDS22085.1 TatD DNase family protein [Paraoerskovia marina]
MPKPRERGWPAAPEALPAVAVDNHTHLDAIAPYAQGVRDRLRVAEARRRGHEVPAGADDMDLVEVPIRVPSVADVVADAAAVGVTRMVQVGCDLDAVRWTDDLLNETAGTAVGGALLGAVAIHPNEAPLHGLGPDAAEDRLEIGPDGLLPTLEPRHATSLDDAIAQVAAVVRANPRIRAIGETGMDLFRTGPRGVEIQRASFRAHVALAKELDLALQIHDRDAHQEVIDVLLADGAPERTVFHCFSGDAEMARIAREQGWYLSFAGPVSFAANDDLRAALRVMPLDHVMVETDAPFLTPHPYRGRPNAPYLLPHTVRTVAKVSGMPLDEVCRVTSSTAQRVYGDW